MRSTPLGRVGFVLDERVPAWRPCLTLQVNPRVLLNGWPSGSAVAVMRFGWLADALRRSGSDLRYELYRPWRHYDAVVFMKSMGPEAARLMVQLRRRGTRVVFDANVDYFTPAWGTFRCAGLEPTEEQTRQATFMAEHADLVIADSLHIAQVVSSRGWPVTCITDHVRDDLLAAQPAGRPVQGEPLPLLWCGEAHKLFELLLIKPMLEEMAGRIRLRIITNDLAALQRWRAPEREAMAELLARVPHEFLPFQSVEALMKVYDGGGIFISPRFMDNSYNLGHTEWKITLPMARGCPVLCSGQPSYLQVAEKAQGRGIRICQTPEDWRAALHQARQPGFDWPAEQEGAMAVVRSHYTTKQVARQHARVMAALIRRDGLTVTP